MNIDARLVDTAVELCKFLDKQADKLLPMEIAGIMNAHHKLVVVSK